MLKTFRIAEIKIRIIIIYFYCSKSPLESTNKNENTFIVKADVHQTDNSDIEPVIKSISKIYSSKQYSQSELNLPIMDDIHIVASENLHLTQTVKPYVQKREKPRWSLRIKLHSSEDSLNGNVIRVRNKKWKFVNIHIEDT